GREIEAPPGHGDFVGSGFFTGDGTSLTTWGGDRTLRTWRLESGQELNHESPTWAASPEILHSSLAFSPDGKTTAIADQNGVVNIWTSGVSKEPARLPGARSSYYALCFSPDGTKLALSGTSDQAITLLNVADGKVIFRKLHHRKNPVI